MRLIFIGPPGVGKGTQAGKICALYGIVHLSTGEILRNEISSNTKTGQSAKKYIDDGKLVPDSILLNMMSSRLAQNDCRKGFCLDGFPRTIPQAEGLESILSDLNQLLTAVVNIVAEEDELVHRLVKRGKTSGRSDDTPEIIRNRLEVYRKQTEPLIDFYTKRNLVKIVDGMGDISEITHRIMKILE